MKNIKLHLFFTLLFALVVTPQISAQDAVKSEELKTAALEQMDKGRYGEAIDLLNKYVSAEPRNPDGYNIRGMCFEKRGQFEYAVSDFRKALKLRENHMEAARNLKRVLAVWHAQLRKKIQGHEREIAINPGLPVNYLEIGKSYKSLEEWVASEEWYDKYLAKDPNASADEIIRYSEVLAANNQIKKGEEKLKEYVDKYPDDWRLWSRYGFFGLWLGHYKQAEKAFTTALKIKPFFKEAQDGLDQATKKAYITQDDPRQSEKEFPIDRYYRILRTNPEDISTRYKLIDDLIKASRIEEAFTQLLAVRVKLQNDPKFQEKFDYVVELRDKLYLEKIDQFQAKVDANPLDKDAVRKLAQYHQYLDDYQSAYAVLDNYFYLVPNEPDADMRFQYGRTAAWSRDFEAAIEIIDKLLVDYPSKIDLQLFRAQLSVWTLKDLELADSYLENVLANNPNNIDALISKSSLFLTKNDFDQAQIYADRAAEVDPSNTELTSLQSNIDFRKLRAEEEKHYLILEEGRKLVLAGNCAEALPYYKEYLSKADPNILVIKELGDVLFCAEKYDEAVSAFDEVLAQDFMFDAALQRAKVFYSKGDTNKAISSFKELIELDPKEFEPQLYLGDSYAKAGMYDSAIAVYDTLLTWDLDSARIAIVNQRIGWVPITGLASIFDNFPSGIGVAPIVSFYSDNLGFRFQKIGTRVDLGITSFLSAGISLFNYNTWANPSTLDSAKVALVAQNNTFSGSASFKAIKGHLFATVNKNISAGVGYGSLNTADFISSEMDLYVLIEEKKVFKILGSFINSDGVIILYSPYLINYKDILGQRLRADLFKAEAEYYDREFKLSGSFQMVRISDLNEGNDIEIRFAKIINKQLNVGYEYYFSNYKYADIAKSLYYAPRDFESHSAFGEYYFAERDDFILFSAAKLGYVPATNYVLLEGNLKLEYKILKNLTMTAAIGLGSTTQDNSGYRYFGGSFGAYWTL
ncbi:MAG: tetratricopeptide repeat protein [Bacteroidetes bacterium]|nr:tetratricopeptide repeat protein [Bacteroidota bacterium]MBU1679894.1 tetratricopeptide repeat protein [Bacteroidota bacterium]